MSTPDFMPILSKGAHDSPTEGACVMEMVSFLAGEEWSDRPACTHPVLAEMARVVNDRLPDADRQQILPLMGRLFGTAPTGTPHEQRVLSVRLAAWCVRQVLDLAPDRSVALTAIETAERWCDGLATEQECRDAANAAAYAANDRLLPLLSGLIDHYDSLTGRTEHRQITDADHRELVALTNP